MFKKILALILAAATCLALTLSLASCTQKEEEKLGESEALLPRNAIVNDVTVPSDFKIGLICLHDENSTYDKNFIDAFKSVVTALNIPESNYFIKTPVPESNECYEAAKDLAQKGCSIVFADSFGHEGFLKQAAQEFTNVQFCHATGTSSKIAGIDNFHNAFASIYEGRYVAGVAAGLKLNEMIEDKKITAEEAVIGYVGAFTYAEVISGMTSFFLGARSVCPSATMKVRYTGSWYDYDAEKEAANALIAKDKCVLISQHADSLGAPSACEAAGVPNVSYNGSTYNAGEETFLISSAINWAPYFKYIITQVVKGEAIDTDWCGTIATNSVVLTGINQDVVAKGTMEKLQQVIADLKSGKIHVFSTDSFTVGGKHLDVYNADIDGDPDTDVNVIHDGYFDESNADLFRSAPYFDLIIDGVTNLNTNFG